MDDWHETGLTVGQVAQRMKITRSAVRWYDDHGLLPSERTAGNQRRFFADVQCRVAMIRAAQRVGLSIAEIREALSDLPPDSHPHSKTGSASPPGYATWPTSASTSSSTSSRSSRPTNRTLPTRNADAVTPAAHSRPNSRTMAGDARESPALNSIRETPVP